jgi:curli production assembly/transport component CsgG
MIGVLRYARIGRLAGAASGALILGVLMTGCASPVPVFDNAQLTPATQFTRDLAKLPPPKGKMVAAVYGFRDQTGQYKPSPDSSFSA